MRVCHVPMMVDCVDGPGCKSRSAHQIGQFAQLERIFLPRSSLQKY